MRDLTVYVANKSIRRRFLKQVAFCQHSKSCQQCCWEWKGSTNKNPYGNFYVCTLSYNPKKALYVRPSWFMWTIAYGHIDKQVLHTCDNTSCVNYNHFFEGMQKDNAKDREQKGRGNRLKGIDNPRAKLTPNTIWHMKALRESGFTYKNISLIVGVDYALSYRVLNNQAWKHLNK